ncbi:Bug family tripartite tricarboxylate transporter substrate binding protein [Azohydromonas australica]|uniref:Bug family tripartite tricarboxylate transporter substrate binding protein n=1 Tax=Azohydromonas australica TaxID=364039 RepID=UPI0004298023|nr:tripartite tricarboxylate transporter substrate-binding protein [Azohydromonas australica]
MRRKALVLAAASLLAFSGVHAEGAYPNRPIKMIATVAPGSAGDTMARRVGEPLGKLLGQPLVVENKPGAQGAIASRAAAKAPADGYTLLLAGNSSHAASVHTMKDLGYDPIKDFTPLTQLSLNPLLLVVNAELPVKNLQEFLRYAREKNGKLNYGIGNSGTLVAAQLLKVQGGFEAVGVNYAGTLQATTDLLGGRLDFMMNDPVVAAAHLQSGKLRVLGITSRQRLASMPDVAPLAELGLPDYDYASWIAVYAPAGLPRDIGQRLHQGLLKAMADPEMAKYLASAGMIPATSSSPDRLMTFNQEQIGLWGRWVKDAGIKPQ